jgi:hypothetical protein
MTTRLLPAVVLALAATVAQAEDAAAPKPLPAMRFIGSVESDEIFALLTADPLFKKLDKELVGSPIVLRVTHSLEPTSGGKASGLATGLLAASTLGLLPVVTNNDLVVYYEVLVNGTAVTTASYRKNFTHSNNIWSKDKTNGLGADGLAWVKTTVPEFLASARQDSKLTELSAEYTFYFARTP